MESIDQRLISNLMDPGARIESRCAPCGLPESNPRVCTSSDSMEKSLPTKKGLPPKHRI